jgi:5-methylcytosine-specific restriction protein B
MNLSEPNDSPEAADDKKSDDRSTWTDDHRVEALELFLLTNAEQLDKRDRKVIDLAIKQHREPSSIAIKLQNFRYLDPNSEAFGAKGMVGFSKRDVICWLNHSGRILSNRALNIIRSKGWLDLLQNINPLSRMLNTRIAKSLLSKPFLILAGPSGSGKTREAIQLAKLLCDADFWAVVAVGADWTDNRHVVGYLNPLKTIDGKSDGLPVYEATEILKLLMHANDPEHRHLPHFLILDEMNLSHVERYFADFLSAMELGDKEGAIKLHAAGLAKSREGLDVPGQIDFPQNLFVIGTVNIDETTYMFSPKVLDRANVLECRPTLKQLQEAAKNLGSPLASRGLGNPDAETAKSFLSLALKASDYRWKPDDPAPSKSEWEKFVATLHDISKDILEPAGLELTYRPQKEIMAYARVDYYFHREGGGASTPIEPSSGDDAQGQEDSEANGTAGVAESGDTPAASATIAKWDWQRCLDEQIMQKILPKLVGNERKLRDVLGKLKDFCEKNLLTEADKARVAEKREREPGDRNLSHAKILQMQRRLETDRFTGYF